MGWWSVLGAETVWLAVAMSAAWAVQRATRNCGWVDAIWSGATALGGAVGALMPAGGAAGPRAWLAAAMVGVWGARLAWHIARRTPGAPEDPRYAGFRREWGAAFEPRLFGLLMVQAAAAWVLVASVVISARNPAPLRPADFGGALLLAGALWGEATADAQLRRFRAARRGPICDTGLWAWSRHPNYFFEFLAWCAYPVLAIDWPSYPAGVLALAAPALMFVLLRYVSGVPPLEAAMLASRGDTFRAYQARVGIFFLRPPVKEAVLF